MTGAVNAALAFFCKRNTMSADEKQIHLEVLQPDISGEILKATSEELKNWIREGRLKPYHQVRIKDLSWVEARKIPAFKSLFESEHNPEAQTNFFSNSSSFNTSVSKNVKPETNETKTLSKKESSTDNNSSTKNESKPAEPSIPFQIFEKKALAKSKQNEPKSKNTGSKTQNFRSKTKATSGLYKHRKKSSNIKNILIFLGGIILTFLLSLGGSYLWNYQLKSPVEVDEKTVPELASLVDKLTSDRLELRVKAAKENNQADLSQQIAQLEKQYETKRKNIIENHRVKLQDADFYTTFYFSFAALLVLFLMFRIFFGKTPQPAEIRFSPKSPARKSSAGSDIPATGIEEIDGEISGVRETEIENSEAIGTNGAEDSDFIKQPKKSRAESANDEEAGSDAEESEQLANCVLHKGRASVFVCEVCDNHFCGECLKTFGDVEKCCPFCKVVCKALEANKKKTETPEDEKKENKPVNLLELNKENSDFVVYDYEEERSRVAGVIQALVIALFFSAAISILWTYKINPYLENRNTETQAQNVSPDGNSNQIPLNADPATYNKEIDDALKTGPCIDPETKQPFECDEETRRALYEHTRKTQSVEKAKSDVLNTTKLLTGSDDENKESEDPQMIAAKAEQEKKEKRQLIASFGISFVLIFGILLATVFFSKDKKTFLNQNKEEEAGEETEEEDEEAEEIE